MKHDETAKYADPAGGWGHAVWQGSGRDTRWPPPVRLLYMPAPPEAGPALVSKPVLCLFVSWENTGDEGGLDPPSPSPIISPGGMLA